jgi:hypothetical protein
LDKAQGQLYLLFTHSPATNGNQTLTLGGGGAEMQGKAFHISENFVKYFSFWLILNDTFLDKFVLTK